ncbi:MAG: hypothetical protein WD688_20170 [Candidatus Binatia bacterium]
MQLREHPKIAWPPIWSQGDERSQVGEDATLKDVDLIAPTKLLLSAEYDSSVYFAEIYCFNKTFASWLQEKLESSVGTPIKEIGELEIAT